MPSRGDDLHYVMEQTPKLSLVNRLAQRLYQVVRDYPVDPIELLGSVMCIGYGGVLLAPMHTFGAGRGFAVVARWMPEEVAGLLFLSIGILWFVGLMVRHRWLRIIASFLGMLAFTYWASMLGYANFPGGGWYTYGVFAVICVWACWRNCGRL